MTARAPRRARGAKARALLATLILACSACGRPAPEGHALRAHELNVRGAIALRAGNLAAAEAAFQAALEEAAAIDDIRGRAMALANLARVDEELGALTRAQARYREAAALARVVRSRALEAAALAGLAHARSLAGDHDAAVKIARKAVGLAIDGTRDDDADEAAVPSRRATLAWILWRAGDCAAATTELVAAAGGVPGDAGHTHSAISYVRGLIALERGDAAAARRALDEALAVDRARDAALDTGDDLRALSRAAAATGDEAAALDYLDRALRLHLAVNATHRVLADLEALAALHRAVGAAGAHEARAAHLENEARTLRAAMGATLAVTATAAAARGCEGD